MFAVGAREASNIALPWRHDRGENGGRCDGQRIASRCVLPVKVGAQVGDGLTWGTEIIAQARATRSGFKKRAATITPQERPSPEHTILGSRERRPEGEKTASPQREDCSEQGRGCEAPPTGQGPLQPRLGRRPAIYRPLEAMRT